MLKTLTGIIFISSVLYSGGLNFDIERKKCRVDKNAKSCLKLGLYFKSGENGSTTPDYYEAVKYYKLSCKYGNSEGCLAMSHCYQVGKALPISERGYLKYMSYACQYGDKKACENISINKI